MSLKVLLIGALCLLALAESKATHSKSLKSEVDPTVSDITTCTPDCGGDTGTENPFIDPNPGTNENTSTERNPGGPVTGRNPETESPNTESHSTEKDSTTEEPTNTVNPVNGENPSEGNTEESHSTGEHFSTVTDESTSTEESTGTDKNPNTDENSTTVNPPTEGNPGHETGDPRTSTEFPTHESSPTDPSPDELVVNQRVCTTECGISSSKKRVIALLLKLINILGEEAKSQSLNVFVDVSLDRFQESRYGELTKNVAIILGNYEGSFTGALKYIVDSSYGYVDDSQTIDVDDAFEVIFNVKSDRTSIKQSASQVLLIAVYAAYRIENTDVEFDDLGTFEGNFATDLRVLVELATAVVRQVQHNIDDDQIASTFSTLTSASFTVQVSGDVVTVESVDDSETEVSTATESETAETVIGDEVSEIATGIGNSVSYEITESGGGDDGAGETVTGSNGIIIGYGGKSTGSYGYKWASARARDAPLFKKSVKAHSLKSKDHSLKSHAKTAKSHATLAKTHAKLAKAHEKSKSKSHLKSSKAHQKNNHHQKSSKAHQKNNHHQKSSKAHQKSKSHQNQSKNHHSKSKSHHASKSKGHTQKNKNQQKSKSHQ